MHKWGNFYCHIDLFGGGWRICARSCWRWLKPSIQWLQLCLVLSSFPATLLHSYPFLSFSTVSSLSASDFHVCSYFRVTFNIIIAVISLTFISPVSTPSLHIPFLGPVLVSLGLGLKQCLDFSKSFASFSPACQKNPLPSLLCRFRSCYLQVPI